ncbi:hypothetical protein [Halorubrum sp. GN11GM_10-3_MGM]|uniref:hypothetical protein n=1 Tax=Halorubrum sp. GN11GM_10-3_MGM TaxID=2518111 RepID=UPI0010F97A7E|nr:hypothetical protein [Halorubrum sp. GN11GM_10-3_MGM]TKX72186.1 hypothetical protein EXE40_04910 [Halorubrum sp. GN11GM_10-3_MGM]
MNGNILEIVVSILLILLALLMLVYGFSGEFLLEQVGDADRVAGVVLGSIGLYGGFDQIGVIES